MPDPDEEVLRRRVSVGAICVYQDCYNILQVFLKKRGAVSGNESTALAEVKDRLVSAVNNRNITEVAQCVKKLRQLFLLIHAKRMLKFIKPPHKIATLNNACQILNADKDVSYSNLEQENRTLNMNFTLQQKESVENFLVYLDQYFDVKLTRRVNQSGPKKFMVCRRGHVFESKKITDDKTRTPGDIEEECRRCNPTAAGDITDTKDDQHSSKSVRELIEEILDQETAPRKLALSEILAAMKLKDKPTERISSLKDWLQGRKKTGTELSTNSALGDLKRSCTVTRADGFATTSALQTPVLKTVIREPKRATLTSTKRLSNDRKSDDIEREIDEYVERLLSNEKQAHLDPFDYNDYDWSD